MSTGQDAREQCRATRKDGTPCRALAVVDGYCVGHRPGAAESRARGGHGRSNAARVLKMVPARLRPVADMLEKALRDLEAGDIEPRTATAMASVATAFVRVVQAGELEDRMRSVEAALREKESDSAA